MITVTIVTRGVTPIIDRKFSIAGKFSEYVPNLRIDILEETFAEICNLLYKLSKKFCCFSKATQKPYLTRYILTKFYLKGCNRVAMKPTNLPTNLRYPA